MKAGEDVINGYVVRDQGSPMTVPNPTIPTEQNPQSQKRVILYRDTHGWCPFCMRVWMVGTLEAGKNCMMI